MAEFAVRGEFPLNQTSLDQKNETPDISQVLASCFHEDDGITLDLKDEFSAKTISFVISGCRSLLREASENAGCWDSVRQFLEGELRKFSRLKEEFVESERKCGMIQQKLEEISHPKDGQMNQTRMMACAMLMAENEMRRDNLGDRVSMIINEFVSRILAGTQNTPGGDVLELRLRGVFGSL